MNFKRDRDNGLFARSPESRLVYIEAAYIFVSVLNAAVIALVSMRLMGIFTSAGSEILLMLVYMLLCVALCIVLGELSDSIGLLGALIPILTIVMLILCPVFINIANIPQIQLLLPPFYYLSAIRNIKYIAYSVIYLVASVALYVLLRLIKYGLLQLKYRKEKQL